MRIFTLMLVSVLSWNAPVALAEHTRDSAFSDREAAILRAAANVAAVMRGQTPPYGSEAYDRYGYYPASAGYRYDDDDDDDDHDYDDDYEDREKAYRKQIRKERKAYAKQLRKERKAYEKHLRKQRGAYLDHPRQDGRFLPPGLRKRAHDLPPGWERKLRAGRVLPYDVYHRGYPVSGDLAARLGYVPGTELLVFDDKVARIAADTRLVLDVISLLAGR